MLSKKFNFADNSNVNASKFTSYTGSNWNNDSNAGTFKLNLNNSTSNSNSNLGAHLKYFFSLVIFYKSVEWRAYLHYFMCEEKITIPLGKKYKIQDCASNIELNAWSFKKMNK